MHGGRHLPGSFLMLWLDSEREKRVTLGHRNKSHLDAAPPCPCWTLLRYFTDSQKVPQVKPQVPWGQQMPHTPRAVLPVPGCPSHPRPCSAGSHLNPSCTDGQDVVSAELRPILCSSALAAEALEELCRVCLTMIHPGPTQGRAWHQPP